MRAKAARRTARIFGVIIGIGERHIFDRTVGGQPSQHRGGVVDIGPDVGIGNIVRRERAQIGEGAVEVILEPGGARNVASRYPDAGARGRRRTAPQPVLFDYQHVRPVLRGDEGRKHSPCARSHHQDIDLFVPIAHAEFPDEFYWEIVACRMGPCLSKRPRAMRARGQGGAAILNPGRPSSP